mmetsp:Transcript_22199/g.67402  ORF Transcript_22199/g.67402 Transcript_22199/m.67402 type:complete len:271 (-) Transcript_22199:130-942(-)|eukprot:scaffold28556_cov27-Tisochrysis_lutea.AAC.1
MGAIGACERNVCARTKQERPRLKRINLKRGAGIQGGKLKVCFGAPSAERQGGQSQMGSRPFQQQKDEARGIHAVHRSSEFQRSAPGRNRHLDTILFLSGVANCGSGKHVGPCVPLVVLQQLCRRPLPWRARPGGAVATDKAADTRPKSWRNMGRRGCCAAFAGARKTAVWPRATLEAATRAFQARPSVFPCSCCCVCLGCSTVALSEARGRARAFDWPFPAGMCRGSACLLCGMRVRVSEAQLGGPSRVALLERRAWLGARAGERRGRVC